MGAAESIAPDSAVVVALGGNIGGLEAVRARFDEVIARLSEVWGPARVSPWYRSAPVGAVVDQEEFLNGVAAFAPHPLPDPADALARLHALEASMGRVRGAKDGPRTLDLDLLLVGSSLVKPETLGGLCLPHPRMHERAFVLRPLCDLFGAGFRWPPETATVGELLQRPVVASQKLQRYTPPR